ncbi:root hair defective 3 GTP-binding protein-domain-containing protein [Flammula alnicola]|nr:root hair defective 3 GTP-binding protein-domain-containing protein [Flammula alnicola]
MRFNSVVILSVSFIASLAAGLVIPSDDVEARDLEVLAAGAQVYQKARTAAAAPATLCRNAILHGTALMRSRAPAFQEWSDWTAPTVSLVAVYKLREGADPPFVSDSEDVAFYKNADESTKNLAGFLLAHVLFPRLALWDSDFPMPDLTDIKNHCLLTGTFHCQPKRKPKDVSTELPALPATSPIHWELLAATEHIINTEQEFLDGLGDEMVKWEMNNIGSDYETVAIIGSQSSGKSTLLNNMFGTDFTVMDPRVRGIWLSRDKTHNVIVMDVEGSDGASRGDDQNFERKSALFALACSRLVIVNMWENQVGLYNGANMGLLKIIFEEHLSLYGNLDRHLYQSPKIIFIIQAHCSGISLESLAHTITLDLNRIWDSIQKPDELRNKTLGDYFDFGFESLTHMLLASEQYKSQVDLLRRRFVERESTEYVLRQARTNTVPADGLELYMTTIWETIRLNENLDLPGQHELLARAMCNKISTSLLERCRHQIASQLAILNDGQVIHDLGSRMQDWKSELLVHYDRDARRYVQSVYVETRNALINSYHNEILELFTRQLKNLRLSLLTAFDAVLEDTITKDDSEFATITSRKKQGYEEDFTTAVRNTAIDDANWDWEHEFQELQSGLANRIKACEKERKVPSPIQATKTEWVTSTKLMTTKATLYRDGKLMVEVDTNNNTFNHALRGRVVVIVLDKEGSTIAVTNEMHCTLRGGFNPFGSPRCGRDVFSQQFPQDVGRAATDANSPGHHLEKFLKAAQVVAVSVAAVG